MGHEIEIYEDKAAFVSAREDAWHQLGTVVNEGLTAEQALELAHLSNWNVRKEPLYIGSGQVVEDKFATIRNSPFIEGQVDVLGVVGSKYQPIQNEDHAELLNALVDESGAHFETAGSLRGGKQTFITMKMPNHINIGNLDPIETYIAALNGHDGLSSFQFIVTPVRIVCANTQAAALSAAQRRFSVRHTRNGADGILLQARETLNMTFKFMEAFEVEAERMIQKSLTDAEFDRIISFLYPIPDDASDLVKDRASAQQDKLMELFLDSPTNTEIRGTAWAGYQAVTEYLDHFAIVQGKDAEANAYRRALNVATGASDSIKGQAFQLLQYA